MSIEGLRLNAKKLLIKKFADSRRKQLKNTEFTIISNNCWGGMVYESFNLPKQSPTVGLFFMADEYIRFLQEFPNILGEEIKFISPYESRYIDFLRLDNRFGTYPIGMIGNIEISFLHYHSEEEVISKWRRRCERIVPENILIKMNDQNLCTEEHIQKFEHIPLENKVFFSSKQYKGMDNLIYISEARKQECVYASQEPVIFRRHFDEIKYINEL